MNKTLLKKKYIFFILIISGCATIENVGTKPMPLSEPAQVILPLPNIFKNKTVAVYLSTDRTKVDGGHYEGLLQAKQVWITGLSKKQKQVLYGNAVETSLFSFMDELGRQGVLISFIKEWDNKVYELFDYVIAGDIENIILNTYGRGFKAGRDYWGSAGNYWEARISLNAVKIFEKFSQKTIYEGKIETYAKLAPCPVKLDWTVFTIISNSLSAAFVTPAKSILGTLVEGRETLYKWKATYQMDGYIITPVEVASRKAACELLAKLR